MSLTLIRSMTRSAVFELENELCYRPAHPFTVALNGKTVYEACNTNVFSLFSLLPGTTGTPASIMVRLASDLLPILWIRSADGPINRILHFSHSSANLAFSDRNPKPG